MKLNLRILTLLLIGLFSMLSSVSYADETPESVQLTLAVTAADRISLTSVKMVEKGLNAYEAIKQLVVVGVKDTSYGPQIMSLGGVEAIGNTYWALYVNGSMSMVGAQDVILLDDTFIRLNMEDF
ncbi:DUF4430 domain-containing protein [Candidatus Pseudothioglobus singularis]|nr:DUF4430 domain-containing protein [Candidatus Pseudothioglobus singularis]MDA8692308.1 DUF4430 domain-containing protein [Candidatus Pseudothioglobus singularis]MDB0021218.1 DUF4430 domain-containing protein [Candidatus Pseudothioglobus singularis]MDB4847620.1 DUF4430 domain-containing protein [Candidatus Pseudothioglobus singularis]